MDTITTEEYLAHKARKQVKNKLGAVQKEYNGHKYPSIKEAAYAMNLDFRLKAKNDCLLRWERQVNFKLAVNGMHVTTYRLDFLEHNRDGSRIYVDVKGRRSGNAYEMFRIKKRLMLALLGIDVIEK